MITFEQDILNACRVLSRGGILLYPTDTVWGLGCDARFASAVKRIYALKHRADSKAMISLVADYAMLEKYVGANGVATYTDLQHKFSKPLTLIFPQVTGVSDELLASNGSCGMRVTDESFSQALCRAIDGALVSTSANISGEPTPRFYGEISPDIVNGVDYVAHYRQDDTTVGESSAVVLVDSETNQPKVLRP